MQDNAAGCLRRSLDAGRPQNGRGRRRRGRRARKQRWLPQDGAIEEVPIDEVRRQFETNVFGLARLTQLVLPGMRRQGWGRIINVSSMGGRLTFPGGGYYHATKHAVEAISDALRFEVRPFGIDVVVIEPGPIKTA